MPDELTQEEIQQERSDAAKEVFGEDTKFDAIEPEADDAPIVDDPEEDDPWAGVSPALRDQFEAMTKKVEGFDEMAGRLKQAESRIGGITNKLHEAENAAKELREEKKLAPTEAEVDAAAKSEETWDELKDEFPVWAEAIDSRLAAERAKHEESFKTITDLQEKIKAFESAGSSEDTDKKLERMREELKVEIRHPGWETTIKSKEFVGWFQTQPEDVKAKANSIKSSDANYVLDLFDKRGNGGKTPAQIEANRKKRLINSELPSSGSKRKVIQSEDDMTDEEYRKKLSKEIWTD